MSKSSSQSDAPRVPGVYRIRNSINGACYIGSTLDFGRRWWQHRNALRRGVSSSVKLQLAWNKYGEDVFVFEPLLACDGERLAIYEQLYIDHYEREGRLKYNCLLSASLGDAMRGRKQSQEHIEKRASKIRGRKLTANEMEAARRPKTEECKRKISASKTGRSMSLAVKEKISSTCRGRRKSPETRARMSLAMKKRHENARSRGVKWIGANLTLARWGKEF